MHSILRTFRLVMTLLILSQVLPVDAQETNGLEWSGSFKDGTAITEADLKKILSEHAIWLDYLEKKGEFLDLDKLGLYIYNLNVEKPIGADVYRANLRGADLRGANLREADLMGADLMGADLRGANLEEANLMQTILAGANLSKARLRRANLRRASMHKSNLKSADMPAADLRRTFLRDADLRKTNLYIADLRGASLMRADLRKSRLPKANLSEANLEGAKLGGANLKGADLSGANLKEADLSGANLKEADLSNCILSGVKNFPTIYEPKLGTVPYIPSIAKLPNLEKLTYQEFPHGLVALRQGFKTFGLREQERKITYAIKYTERLSNEKKGGLDKLKSFLHFFFFEITCQYGLKPFRPLLILLILIPFFAVFYFSALKDRNQKSGIWLLFMKERVLNAVEGERPFKLTFYFPSRPLPSTKLGQISFYMSRWLRAIRIALYFSFLSAFRIGWRELNVGNWITRVQKREYILAATGWSRTVSGLQSLISVYLLALWALTYFGRPFAGF